MHMPSSKGVVKIMQIIQIMQTVFMYARGTVDLTDIIR